MAYLKKLNSVNSIELTATSATGGFIKQTHPATSGEYAGTHPLLHTWTAQTTEDQTRASNLFVGQKAGNLSDTLIGTQNVAVGEFAGNALTSATIDSVLRSGGANTLVGWYAGKVISYGDNNVGIGKQSLTSLTTGQYCTAVGSLSLGSSVGGTQNSAVGQGSLYNLITGGNNVGVGASCGSYAAGGSTLVTLANNCTFLGTTSGSNLASGSVYRTALGSGSICQANNAIKLGRDGTSAATPGDAVIFPTYTANQLAAYSGMVAGMVIYNSSVPALQVYTGGVWRSIGLA